MRRRGANEPSAKPACRQNSKRPRTRRASRFYRGTTVVVFTKQWTVLPPKIIFRSWVSVIVVISDGLAGKENVIAVFA